MMIYAEGKRRNSAKRAGGSGWTSLTLEHVLLLPDPPFLIVMNSRAASLPANAAEPSTVGTNAAA